MHEFTKYILRQATGVTSHIGSLDLEVLTRYRGVPGAAGVHQTEPAVPRAKEFTSYSHEFQKLQEFTRYSQEFQELRSSTVTLVSSRSCKTESGTGAYRSSRN